MVHAVMGWWKSLNPWTQAALVIAFYVVGIAVVLAS